MMDKHIAEKWARELRESAKAHSNWVWAERAKIADGDDSDWSPEMTEAIDDFEKAARHLAHYIEIDVKKQYPKVPDSPSKIYRKENS